MDSNITLNDIKETCHIVYIIIKRRIPLFTVAVSIVDIVLMIWLVSIDGFAPPAQNPMLGPNETTILENGAKWTPYIVRRGEWWRLISPMFLHIGFVHLLSNLVVQLCCGWWLEFRYGSLKYGILYILSGVGGTLTSAIFLPYLVSVGASGAIYGTISLFLLDLIQEYHTRYRGSFFVKMSLITTIISILVSFLIGLLPMIDNYMHLGGFVFGMELSLIMFLPFSLNFSYADFHQYWNRISMKMRVRIVIVPIMLCLYVCHMVGFFYLLYEWPDVRIWCPDCKYLSCIPREVNGRDWCY